MSSHLINLEIRNAIKNNTGHYAFGQAKFLCQISVLFTSNLIQDQLADNLSCTSGSLFEGLLRASYAEVSADSWNVSGAPRLVDVSFYKYYLTLTHILKLSDIVYM